MIATTSETCLNPQRRAEVRSHGSNGIDYVEVSESRLMLTVYFLGKVPENLEKANVVINAEPGGKKIQSLELRLCSVEDPELDSCVMISLDQRGDKGAYTIRLAELDGQGEPAGTPLKGLDPRYAQAGFHFDTDATSDIDCKRPEVCPATPLNAPDINYLAKDYGSFLQLIYDRLALLMPAWQEQHVPDEGVALVEILAYAGDYLSYYQDAVGTEAYLSTARQRISVRRHVRLLDYPMHEGCNARAWVVVNVSQKVTGLNPAQMHFVAGDQGLAAGPVLSSKDLARVPLGSYLVFDPVTPDLINLDPAQNQIRFYTWGDQQCCLLRGATSATLLDGVAAPPAAVQVPPQEKGAARRKKVAGPPEYANPPKAPAQQKPSLLLKPGDVLLLKEVLGTVSGSPDDADLAHRQFVRLTEVTPGFDHLFNPPVPVVEVKWAVEDALKFDLCLSAIGPAAQGCQPLSDVSVACGNVILVDQGSWIGQTETLGTVPLSVAQQTCESVNHPAEVQIAAGPFRPALKHAPLTHRQAPDLSQPAALALIQNPRSALPQITLRSIAPLPDGSGPLFIPEEFVHPELLAARVANGSDEATQWLVERLSKKTIALLKAFDPKSMDAASTRDKIAQALRPYIRVWNSKSDLLSSGAGDYDYVVETDDAGVAHLRFGDGVLGRAAQAGETFFADYRIGNGPDGNLGAGAIRYVVPSTQDLGNPASVLTPSNPMPAEGGTLPEPVEEVKLFAPGAFLTTLERAITADDYAAIAERNPKVQRAAATLLWTGTGYEAHVAIDPLGTDTVDPGLLQEIQHDLYRFRRIGHDLLVVAAQYAPLNVAMTVNVLPDYIAGHVRAALLDAFSDRVLASGARGFFHPDNLSLGDNIYLSRLVAAAQAVTGVASVTVTRLERLEAGPNHELENGFLPIGPLEVAELENDPSRPQRGKLMLTLRGGL
jgi:hypothetical protein